MATATRSRRRRAVGSSDEKEDELDRKDARISTARNKMAMVEAMAARKGHVAKACEDVGISRMTHFRWRRDDPEYDEAIESLREGLIDDLETLLLKWSVEDRDKRSLRWILERLRKQEYSKVEKTEISGPDGGPVEGRLMVESLREQIPEESLALALKDLVSENPNLLKPRKKRKDAGTKKGKK